MTFAAFVHKVLENGVLPKLFRWVPLPKSIYRHLYFRAPFTLKVENGSSIRLYQFGHEVENDLFWSGLDGDWEAESLRVWRVLVKHANTILDVGANTGIYALIAKCLNSSAQVHAIEPMPLISQKIATNNDLNKFDIIIHTLGLSNYTGSAVVFTEDTDFQYSVAVNKDVSSGRAKNKVEIKVERLDDFAHRMSIDSIELIKLDVESHEPEVLEGMGMLLQQWHPSILIEVWGTDGLKDILSRIDGIDYKIFHVQDDKKRLVPLNLEAPTFGGNYLLLGPQHHSLINSLFGRK